MPRQARTLSSTGMYHVVIRGIDRQTIFYEQKDYLKYLDILSYYKEECNFNLLAYCLMSNHVHLVVKVNRTPLETIFHKINTRYAVWFNLKYNRVGHLQQERYYSEPIEDILYLFNAIQYVHYNPCKAGLEKSPGTDYPWNSIHEFATGKTRLADIPFVLKFLPKETLLDYTRYTEAESLIDIDKFTKKIPDDVAKDILFNISKVKALTDIPNLPLKAQMNIIQSAYKNGLSVRQINRLAGVPRGFVSRIIADEKE